VSFFLARDCSSSLAAQGGRQTTTSDGWPRPSIRVRRITRPLTRPGSPVHLKMVSRKCVPAQLESQVQAHFASGKLGRAIRCHDELLVKVKIQTFDPPGPYHPTASRPCMVSDRGRHPGFPSFNVLAGGPGSLALAFGGGEGFRDVCQDP